jgi:hypothetical protein
MTEQPQETQEQQAAEAKRLLLQTYQQGKAAFEHGAYRESVEKLTKASALLGETASSRLGGEVQMWLVNAYAAADQRQEALALCRQLTHHPSLETRKQSRRLLYILEAPQLKRPAAWLTQIPDLSTVEDNEPKSRKRNFGKSAPTFKPAPKPTTMPEPIDLSQVETRDNQFIWVALIAMGLGLGLTAWFGR